MEARRTIDAGTPSEDARALLRRWWVIALWVGTVALTIFVVWVTASRLRRPTEARSDGAGESDERIERGELRGGTGYGVGNEDSVGSGRPDRVTTTADGRRPVSDVRQSPIDDRESFAPEAPPRDRR